MTGAETAAEWAGAQLARVRDDPQARVELLSRTYRGPPGLAPRRPSFRRAAMSFMRWQVERGILRPLEASPPGSRWWRAVNDRLLADGCEAMARAAGLRGEPSSPTIATWMAFAAKPNARTWYRAHNASIVSAYLENRDLAERESLPERFFLNVALLRVLYAHALVAAPRLSLGRFAPLGGLLGDPRLGMAGAFLSLGRVLPDRYPLRADVEAYLVDEHRIGRLLDYGVIAPRLQALYEWSAGELGLPGLREFVHDGIPAYAWAHEDRDVWLQPRETLPVRILRAATAPR